MGRSDTMKSKKDKDKEGFEKERREFLKRSARDIGACGYAIYELTKTIKEEIMQEVIEDIKEAIRRA